MLVLFKQNMLYCIKKIRHRFYKTIFPNTDKRKSGTVDSDFIELKCAKKSDNTSVY